MSRIFENYVEEAKKAIAYPKSGMIAALRTGLGKGLTAPPVSKGIAAAFFNLTQVMYIKHLDEFNLNQLDDDKKAQLEILMTRFDERLTDQFDKDNPNNKDRIVNENKTVNLVNLFQKILTQDQNHTDNLKTILDILHTVVANVAPYNDKAALKPFKTAIHQFAREMQGIADEEIKSIEITTITAKNRVQLPADTIDTLERENVVNQQRIDTLEQLKKTDFECRIFDTQKLTNKLTQQVKELQQLNQVQQKITQLQESFATNPHTCQQDVKNLITQIEQDIKTAETITNGSFSFSITGAKLLLILQAVLSHLNELVALKIDENTPSDEKIAHIKLTIDNINTTLGDIPAQLGKTDTQLTALKKYLESKNNHNASYCILARLEQEHLTLLKKYCNDEDGRATINHPELCQKINSIDQNTNAYQTLRFTRAEYEEILKAVSNQKNDKENTKRIASLLEPNFEDDEDPSRDHQAYHVIPRNQHVNLGYDAELNSNDLDPLTDNDTYYRKKNSKNKLKWLATLNSLIVALGQGMIPFVFAIGPAGLALALTIGIAGTLCNFFLFRGDAYGVLKDLRFGTFFLDKDGQPLSDTKKRWVKVGLVFAALSALTTGLLTFMSTKAGIIKLCLLFGFASGPAAPIVIGVFIAGLTTFALGFVFTQIVTKWIREDTLQKVWRNLTWHNIKNYFEPPEYLKTKKQRYEYIAKQVLNIILTPIAVAVAIAVSAVVVGIFSRQSAAVFSIIDKSIRISQTISTLLIGTVGTVINALNIIFYSRAIWFLKNAAVDILLAVGNSILHPIDTIKAGAAWLAGKTKPAEAIEMTAIPTQSSANESSTDAAAIVPAPPRQNSTRSIGDRLRMLARASSLIEIFTLLVAIVFNAMGQGDGATAANSVVSPFAYARPLRFLNPDSLVSGSFSVNARPGIAACKKDTDPYKREWSEGNDSASVTAMTNPYSPGLLAQTSHGVLTDDAAALLGAPLPKDGCTIL